MRHQWTEAQIKPFRLNGESIRRLVGFEMVVNGASELSRQE
jgi:hypothetical protein